MTMIVVGPYIMEQDRGKWNVYKRSDSGCSKELVDSGLSKKVAGDLIKKLNRGVGNV